MKHDLSHARSSTPFLSPTIAAEVDALRVALARPVPTLPSRYFYDDRGSELFEEITLQPEYYLTRTEDRILESLAPPLVRKLRCVELVELGSGAGHKVRLFLDAMQRTGTLERCAMVDVSRRTLIESVFRLGVHYPGLPVAAICADFVHSLHEIGPGGSGRRLLMLLGSTIGNFEPPDVTSFIARAARQLAEGDAFLLGVDQVKDRAVLEAAYNDAAGVTAEFNRNILNVVNDRFGANFEPGAFDHVAFWNDARACIEMRLRAQRPMRVRVRATGTELLFRRGFELRTEISCKYTRASFAALVQGTGLALEGWFTDPEQRFAEALLVRREDA